MILPAQLLLLILYLLTIIAARGRQSLRKYMDTMTEGPLKCYSCGTPSLQISNNRQQINGKLGREHCTTSKGNYCYLSWTNSSQNNYFQIRRGCMPWHMLLPQLLHVAEIEPKWPNKRCFVNDQDNVLCVCRRKHFCNKKWPIPILFNMDSINNGTLIHRILSSDEEQCGQKHNPIDTNQTIHKTAKIKPEQDSMETEPPSDMDSKDSTVNINFDNTLISIIKATENSHQIPEDQITTLSSDYEESRLPTDLITTMESFTLDYTIPVLTGNNTTIEIEYVTVTGKETSDDIIQPITINCNEVTADCSLNSETTKAENIAGMATVGYRRPDNRRNSSVSSVETVTFIDLSSLPNQPIELTDTDTDKADEETELFSQSELPKEENSIENQEYDDTNNSGLTRMNPLIPPVLISKPKHVKIDSEQSTESTLRRPIVQAGTEDTDTSTELPKTGSMEEYSGNDELPIDHPLDAAGDSDENLKSQQDTNNKVIPAANPRNGVKQISDTINTIQKLFIFATIPIFYLFYLL